MTDRPAPLVMGVVNVTPDSFSDGGRYLDADAAVAHGLGLVADGADLLDVGGESTRPGARRPSEEEELARVVPVVHALARAGAVVSIDTMRAEVAARALEAGAAMVNDVSGGLAEPDLLRVVAEHHCDLVLMHWRGHADRMAGLATYDDAGGVVAAVRRELGERTDAALAAGVAPDRLIVDPGLGFAKRAEHNWQVLSHLAELVEVARSRGQRVLVGASRKSFLGTLLADDDGTPRDVELREHATAAISLLAAQSGVWAIRVHDVRATRDVLAVRHAVTAAAAAAPTGSGGGRR